MIPRFSSLSIRDKLMLIIVTVTAVVLVVGFGVVLRNDRRMYRQNLVDTTVLLARVTGDSCVSDLAFGDRDETRDTLRRLASTSSVAAAYVYDAEGRLFAQHPSSAPPPAIPFSAARRTFRGGLLYVAEPIAYQGERYGSILLLMPTSALQAATERHVVTMVAVSLLLLLIATWFASRLERVISRPLLDLTAAAREITERHDYTIRVQKKSEDEIGVLCDGFNEMLGEIERRQRERDEADRRTREKSHFLANMSHELRTPLNAIIGFSEILRGRLADRTTAREQLFLENIHTSGQHLLGLVNDILDLSKVEAGLMELKTEVFPIEGAIEGVCALMKGVSSRRQIELAIECEEGLPAIEADPVKVKQILYNLVSNAVKFSSDSSVVTVRALRLSAHLSPLEQEAIRIEVIDHGIGIAAEDHERIFEEFRQLDSGVPRAEGTGLGLTLVRKLVQLHRGKVSVRSALGAGSMFSVDLPLRQSAAAKGVSLSGSKPRLLVLVAENDPAAWIGVQRQLVEAGYLPVRAANADEALHLAQTLVPAAIALDLVLPGADGWQLLSTLKADPITRRIPVILTSATDNRNLSQVLGADDYLLKPVGAAQLIETLERMVVPANDQGELVLISDDVRLHQSLTSQLRPLGYELRHARARSGGIDSATGRSPSMAMVDVSVDGFRGIDVALRLKNDPLTSSLPLVLLASTELTREERASLAGSFGAAAPGSANQNVVAAVQQLIDRRNQRERSTS